MMLNKQLKAMRLVLLKRAWNVFSLYLGVFNCSLTNSMLTASGIILAKKARRPTTRHIAVWKSSPQTHLEWVIFTVINFTVSFFLRNNLLNFVWQLNVIWANLYFNLIVFTLLCIALLLTYYLRLVKNIWQNSVIQSAWTWSKVHITVKLFWKGSEVVWFACLVSFWFSW